GGCALVGVLAEQRRHGGGDLCLVNLDGGAGFTEGLGVRSENREPDVLRAFFLDAVLFPLSQSAAASVVGGNDEGRLVAIRGQGLQRVPQLLDVVVEGVRRVQH